MKKKAFTLIEIIVVISITAMLSGMIFANIRSGGEVSDLRASSQKLTEIFKQAQMMAFSGKQIAGLRADGGYGVYVNDTTTPSVYRLFVNDNDISNYAYNEGSDTVLREFELSNNVFLDAVDHFFIIFVPPSGDIYVGTQSPGSLLSLDEGKNSLLTLRHRGINRYAYIEINSQGQIDLRTP